LLQLKGYDIILGCDWIKQHSPIGLDLRDCSRQLVIQKNGHKRVIFSDFTSLPSKPIISAHKLEKICRTKNVGYIIQVNMLESIDNKETQPSIPLEIHDLLQHYQDIFSDQVMLPPPMPCDHQIPLLQGAKPPNIRPYRIPHK
jgi:hypothetical protein